MPRNVPFLFVPCQILLRQCPETLFRRPKRVFLRPKGVVFGDSRCTSHPAFGEKPIQKTLSKEDPHGTLLRLLPPKLTHASPTAPQPGRYASQSTGPRHATGPARGGARPARILGARAAGLASQELAVSGLERLRPGSATAEPEPTGRSDPQSLEMIGI